MVTITIKGGQYRDVFYVQQAAIRFFFSFGKTRNLANWQTLVKFPIGLDIGIFLLPLSLRGNSQGNGKADYSLFF